MKPIEIVLGWPASNLSPNRRGHWTVAYRARKRYRSDCCAAAKSQIPWDASVSDAAHISLSFFPPDRRRYDIDNLVARMKSGIDGVCDALGIDDKQFQSQSANIAEVKGTALDGGAVRIQIRELK